LAQLEPEREVRRRARLFVRDDVADRERHRPHNAHRPDPVAGAEPGPHVRDRAADEGPAVDGLFDHDAHHPVDAHDPQMKRRGFTLLELIVATSIFAIVIAATYSLFDSARGITTRAEFRSQLFQSARAALQAIENDLRGAVMLSSAYDTGFIGTNVGS